MPVRCTPEPDPSARALIRRSPLAVLVLLILSGCSRPQAAQDDLRIRMNVTPQPPAIGVAHVEILLHDAQGLPLEARSVALEGNMSHPGMKPSLASARRDRQGRWLADLDLTMAGDWLVLVRAQLADGREIERPLPLPGVKAQ